MSALLIEVVLKGSILMTAAAAAIVLLHRASAATRHFVWTLAVVGLLLLPLFSSSLPRWEIAVPISPSDVSSPVDEPTDVSVARLVPVVVADSAPAMPVEPGSSMSIAANVPWVLLAAVGYVLGLLALLGRLVVQRRTARHIAREADEVIDPEWTALLNECAMRIGVRRPVTLLRSRAQLMPMTMGTSEPVIVVPADADAWDEERRTAVLLHELAHISRHDCLTQTLSALACAVYWVHPGAWYVARRLRIEGEVACDDRVLAAGAQAHNYAGHLLEIAYTWSGRRAPALGVGMAGSRKLEGRMRAVLDPQRNRARPTRRAWLAGAAVAAALLLPIAAVSMTTTTASADVRSTLMGSAIADTMSPDETLEQGLQAAGGSDRITGTWEVRAGRSERMRIRLQAGVFSVNVEIDASDVERLAPQLLSSANGPIRFRIAREAGALDIEGTLKAGAGSGTFTFVPSQTFIDGLMARGFARPTAVELMTLARHDLGFAFIDELAAQKYVQPVVSELVRAANHGVDLDFVRGVGQAGYRLGTLDVLIRYRDHGVDPEFIRELRAQGVSDLSPDDLVRARDHGVDAEYIGEMKTLGYGQLPFEVLVRARDHGVDGEYVRGMRQLGYTPTLDDVIRARDHGVTPDYVSVLRDLGYSKLPLEDVIRTRDHGVDPEYVREMRRLGYKLSLPELINVRDHGVTPDYIEAMAAVGYKALPIETLIRLRDHGVTPDYVAEARKRGHNNLSADEIIRLRDRGVASSDYRLDRLVAYLSETKLARHIEKIIRASHKAAHKSQRAVDKSQRAVDKLTR